MNLLDADVELGTLVLRQSSQLLRFLDDAIYSAQQRVIAQHDNAVLMRLKPLVHGRLCNLPICPEITKPNVSSIRTCDAGKFVSISGTIVRTGIVQMLDAEREYECTQCQHRFRVNSNLELHSTMELPKVCPSSMNPVQSRKGKGCKSSSFTYVEGTHVCRDYQEIKVQEQVQKLTVGSIPRSILVVLQDDLADTCQAGDDAVITGLVRCMWAPAAREARCELELFIEANHVTVNNDKKSSVQVTADLRHQFEEFWRTHAKAPLQARDFIVKSICPQLYGLFLTKMALALTLIGGVPKVEQSGTHSCILSAPQ